MLIKQAEEQAAPRRIEIPWTGKTAEELEVQKQRQALQEIFDKGNNWTKGETQSELRERELRQLRESGQTESEIRANA